MKTKLVFFLYSMGQRGHSLRQNRLLSDKRGFGMNELLGVAAAVILAAFIIIPGLQTFAKGVMKGLTDWWNIIDSQIFPTSIT